MPIIERIVTFCCRQAALTVLAACSLTLGAGFYTAAHFAMNTNSERADLGRCGLAQARDRVRPPNFPQQSNLIAGGDRRRHAGTGGSRRRRAHRPARSQDKTLFPDVRRPDGGAFFDHNGMLFLPLADVQATTQQLFKAQPFLGAAGGRSVVARACMDSLSTALLGVSQRPGQARRSGSARWRGSARCSAAAAHGQDRLSVLALADHRRAAQAGRNPPLHRSASPALDFDALEPGLQASDAIRAAARALGLTPDTWRAGAADRRRAAVG